MRPPKVEVSLPREPGPVCAIGYSFVLRNTCKAWTEVPVSQIWRFCEKVGAEANATPPLTRRDKAKAVVATANSTPPRDEPFMRPVYC